MNTSEAYCNPFDESNFFFEDEFLLGDVDVQDVTRPPLRTWIIVDN